MLAAVDLLALLAGVGSIAITGDPGLAALAVLTLPAWGLLFVGYGLYSSGLRRVGHSTVDDLPGLAHVFLIGTLGTWLFLHLSVGRTPGFSQLVLFDAVALSTDVVLRSMVRDLASLVLGNERVLFIGSGPMMPVLARQVLRNANHGLEVVGVITRSENERWPLPAVALGELGSCDASALLREHRVDRVVVSAEGIDDEPLLALVDECRKLNVKVSALPSLAAVIGPSATIDQLEGITLIGLNLPTLPRSSQVLKRIMDLLGASVLMVLSAPFCAVAAVAIKLDTPGPILFRQERIGRGGKPFKLVKFRTMDADAEAQRDALIASSRQKDWLDLEHDPRITRVGRVLRLTSIDELPQLWNVLRGDMSLVGPRPLIEREDRNVSGWARGRLDLTPGLTGTWQVLGRTSIPFEQMVMIDYLYVANWSLWTDFKLLLRTLPIVLSRKGAN